MQKSLQLQFPAEMIKVINEGFGLGAGFRVTWPSSLSSWLLQWLLNGLLPGGALCLCALSQARMSS
jgi:hypothetical protein